MYQDLLVAFASLSAVQSSDTSDGQLILGLGQSHPETCQRRPIKASAIQSFLLHGQDNCFKRLPAVRYCLHLMTSFRNCLLEDDMQLTGHYLGLFLCSAEHRLGKQGI